MKQTKKNSLAFISQYPTHQWSANYVRVVVLNMEAVVELTNHRKFWSIGM